MANFEQLKTKYDAEHQNISTVSCFLPVHLSYDKQETSLYKKDGSYNEQYYKWQFLNCFVESGLCAKDYIGVEVQFPKGNKNAASIKLDGAIFDDKNWFSHYKDLYTKKDDSKWDDLNWLKEHLICGIEFKKEGSKDVKGVFNSQLKAYMNESSKNTVFGILYDEGRLYLFKNVGKSYMRLSDEFNIENKGKTEPTFDVPDGYANLLSFDEMINYRSNDFIKKIGINGSGAESVTKYQLQDIPFPNFPAEKEESIVRLYHNPKVSYEASKSSLENFLEYDRSFNANAGIYELDKSMKYLQSKLEQAIVCIANDEVVEISF